MCSDTSKKVADDPTSRAPTDSEDKSAGTAISGNGSSIRRVTLQFSLSTAFSGIVVLTSLLLGVALYSAMSDSIRDAMRERLETALGVAALGVDVELHEAIREPGGETSPAYLELTRHLRKVRDRVAGVRFVYTYRANPDGQLVFVLDAEEDPKTRSQINQAMRADDITPMMRSVLVDGNKTVQVESQLTADIYGVWLSGYVPLLSRVDGRVSAVLGMDISAVDVLRQERSFLYLLSTLCALIALFMLPIGFAASRWISKPLAELAREMGRVRKFELDGNASTRSRIVEVADMVEAVQGMKSGLRSFRKYVPADLVRQLIRLGRDAELGGESRQLTVFFSDIVGFTSISERAPPDLLVKRLGEYFSEMDAAILGELGTIDKYIGDAVMAFWGAPEPVEDSVLRACRAALAGQKRTAALSARWNDEDFRFATRIGLCCGSAIVGNIGSEERINYTTVGDVVNTASRLENACRYYGVEILISDSVRSGAGEAIVARAVDLVAVKGKGIPLRVHELVGLVGDTPISVVARMRRHDDAFALFAAGDFGAAIPAFEALANETPGDRPVELLLARCRELANDPAAATARIMVNK